MTEMTWTTITIGGARLKDEAEFSCDFDGRPMLYVDDARAHLQAGTLADHLTALEKWAGKDIPPLTVEAASRAAENKAE